MEILVDSNILLDVVTEDPKWFEWSSTMLGLHAEQSVLVINPIVYAEVSIGFDSIEELESALPPNVFRRDELVLRLIRFLDGPIQHAVEPAGEVDLVAVRAAARYLRQPFDLLGGPLRQLLNVDTRTLEQVAGAPARGFE